MPDLSQTSMIARKGIPWSETEDRHLYDCFTSGMATSVLASIHGRSVGGIKARLRRLGLIDSYGVVTSPPPSFIVISRVKSFEPSGSDSASSDRDLKPVFEFETLEGWHVRLLSNLRLDDEKVGRLALMLRGVVERPQKNR